MGKESELRKDRNKDVDVVGWYVGKERVVARPAPKVVVFGLKDSQQG